MAGDSMFFLSIMYTLFITHIFLVLRDSKIIFIVYGSCYKEFGLNMYLYHMGLSKNLDHMRHNARIRIWFEDHDKSY